ncbi:MAG: hypothetical protein K9N46_05670 [Candidatus Marinimicrobia bacterium]|nr:hypothetical protein [Candidatus Neomarinimicrobiota bacterium]MCF7880209.1 hypothetical protein [Candidatus Neomarinimicrobiota bacterium]
MVTVDAGDLFFKVPRPASNARAVADRKADLFIKAYNDFQYDAFNVGINDLALGADFIKAREANAEFPFLSGTVMDSDGELLFDPYTVISRGGQKIGIVGVTTGNEHVDDFTYADVVEAAKQYQSELADKTDYLILLASVFNVDANKLQNADLGYDLIIRSHTSRFSRNAQKTSGGFYMSTGKQGKYIQLVTFHQEDPKEPFVDISRKKQRLDFIKHRLRSYRDQAGDQSLEEAFGDKKQTLAFIQNMQEQQGELQNEIKEVSNYIAVQVQSLNPDVPDDEKWLKEVQEFNQYSQTVRNQ